MVINLLFLKKSIIMKIILLLLFSLFINGSTIFAINLKTKALKLYQKGEITNAVNILEKYLVKNTNDIQAWSDFSLMLYKVNKNPEFVINRINDIKISNQDKYKSAIYFNCGLFFEKNSFLKKALHLYKLAYCFRHNKIILQKIKDLKTKIQLKLISNISIITLENYQIKSNNDKEFLENGSSLDIYINEEYFDSIYINIYYEKPVLIKEIDLNYDYQNDLLLRISQGNKSGQYLMIIFNPDFNGFFHLGRDYIIGDGLKYDPKIKKNKRSDYIPYLTDKEEDSYIDVKTYILQWNKYYPVWELKK